MVKYFIAVIGCILCLFALVVIAGRVYYYYKNRIKSPEGIQEAAYISINGIKQYIQVRGNDIKNPVIIFIHGGPASPMGYVSAYYQKDLENEYTIINYDQRGCGRTYYANKKESCTNIALLLEDLEELVLYAKKRFSQDKVIMIGHSWGTVIGSQYVQQHPENVKAYIGVSQVTDLYDNKLNVARKVLACEEIRGTKAEKELSNLVSKMSQVKHLEDMSLKDLGKLVSLSKKYVACKGEMSPLKQMWLGLTSPDMSVWDIRWFIKQMNTKHFFEVNKQILEYAFFGFKLKEQADTYAVPVYYIGGEGDYAVSQDNVREYFQSIKAPDKQYYMLENTGHSMFMDNPKLYCNTVKRCLCKEHSGILPA